jgi:hypothetical protein
LIKNIFGEQRERERERERNSSTYLPLIDYIMADDDVNREKM